MSAERKVVVITGASQGIGAALVRAFLDRKYRVIATSRSIAPPARAHGTSSPPPALRKSPAPGPASPRLPGRLFIVADDANTPQQTATAIPRRIAQPEDFMTPLMPGFVKLSSSFRRAQGFSLLELRGIRLQYSHADGRRLLREI